MTRARTVVGKWWMRLVAVGATGLIASLIEATFRGLVHGEAFVLLAPPILFPINSLGLASHNEHCSRVFGHPFRMGALMVVALGSLATLLSRLARI